MEHIKIAIDAMGGDNAPQSVIDGMKIASKHHNNFSFILFGNQNQIGVIDDIDPNRFEIIHTEVVIASHDKPSLALKKSMNSSMRLAIECVKKKEAHASVSAGNTGALMAISKSILKSMSIIRRPAICSFIPHRRGISVLLDMGANIECDAQMYLEFGIMGDAFHSAVLGKNGGKIAILNIGSEHGKGGSVLNEASNLIKNSCLGDRFVGYIEPDQVFDGHIDIILTDGFSGNIFIKTLEGGAAWFKDSLISLFSQNILSKVGYFFLSGSMKDMKKMFDHRRYNGAMFVGLNGISVKSHGGADGIGFAHAIDVAVSLVRADVNSRIAIGISKNDLTNLNDVP